MFTFRIDEIKFSSMIKGHFLIAVPVCMLWISVRSQINNSKLLANHKQKNKLIVAFSARSLMENYFVENINIFNFNKPQSMLTYDIFSLIEWAAP